MFIDTHTHLDGEEFDLDRDDVVARARAAGVSHVMVPAIDLPSSRRILEMCRQYPGFAFPMVGLHPEEVKADYGEVLSAMRPLLADAIAVGEVGLDFYWSREYEQQQLEAFRLQVEWACRTRLPLMIHCRKAQNELTHILREYKDDLPGGVFHCFTGNLQEARQLLEFDNFVLGIGGVLTFKKSHLPEVLPQLPIDRIVLETDAPYMAPVPMRGKRNESAYLVHVIQRMAESMGCSPQQVAEQTTRNALRVFDISRQHHP
jgi:TatD DNase family protein